MLFSFHFQIYQGFWMSKVLESEFFLSYCILDLQNQIEFYALTL